MDFSKKRIKVRPNTNFLDASLKGQSENSLFSRVNGYVLNGWDSIHSGGKRFPFIPSHLHDNVEFRHKNGKKPDNTK